MLDSTVVQILLGIVFFTMFGEGVIIQLKSYRKKKGNQATILATSQQIKTKPRPITLMGLAFSDLALLFIALNVFLFPFILQFVPQWDLSVFTSGVQLLGFGLSAGGCLLMLFAYQALGKNWAHALKESKSDAQLVQAGPYKYVRHPVYLAESLIIGGCVLLLLNYILLAFFIAGGIGMYALAKDEENLLMNQFGDAYRDYIKRTGRFFPKISK
jgi:protein-S-isoprenylcysteine O-methyltransferase Ste14